MKAQSAGKEIYMTFVEFMNNLFNQLFTGTNIALIGAAIAVVATGIGSAKGVGQVAEASQGVMAEDPTKFTKLLFLQALPGTQGIYGFITAFILFFKLGLLSTPVEITVTQGVYFALLCMPIAIAGYISAIKQSRVAVAGISVITKHPEESTKPLISAALVEMYAILALLISLLPMLSYQF